MVTPRLPEIVVSTVDFKRSIIYKPDFNAKKHVADPVILETKIAKFWVCDGKVSRKGLNCGAHNTDGKMECGKCGSKKSKNCLTWTRERSWTAAPDGGVEHVSNR